jgi:hypothetical protein
LNCITLRFTGEVWRQSNLAKTLEFSYFIDPTATNTFSTNVTAFLPALNVSFPTVPIDVGGVAVDGTDPLNQTNLGVVNQVITNWPPGAALWLVWEMASPAGKSQGLAIDNLSFSATTAATSTNAPVLNLQGSSLQGTAANQFVLSWPAWATSYQLYSATNLATPVIWSPVPATPAASNDTFYLTIPAASGAAQFFRLGAP